MIITESVDETFGVDASFDFTFGLVRNPRVPSLTAALSCSTSLTKATTEVHVGAPPFVPIATEPMPVVFVTPVGSLLASPSIATS